MENLFSKTPGRLKWNLEIADNYWKGWTMIIREVIPDDADDIARLSQQLGYKCSGRDTSRRLKDLMKSEYDRIFAAVDGDRIQGYIHVNIHRYLYFDSLLNIMGIVVDKDARDRGIGTRLLARAEEFGRSAGCSGIRANSGSDRLNAHEFYRKRGFNSEKDQKRFVKPFH